MNGIESINAIRATLGREIPAIVMTGDVRSKTKDMMSSQDISYLTKPFRIDELLSLIEDHQRAAAAPDHLLVREADPI
jgi:CheY-like chemotaxis protein